MWTHSSWSVLWCKWILVHQHQHVKSSPEGMDVSMKMYAIVLEFTNRIMHRWYHFHRSCYHFHRSWYHFHRSWSWDVWKIRRLLVSADFKGASEFVFLPEVLSVSCSWCAAEGSWGTIVVGAEIKPFINQCSRCFKNPTMTLPSLPTMREVVGGNCCSVTVLSILKASLFVMVVLRSMWRRSPWIILTLLFITMIVVECLILNNLKVRGIV